MTTTYLGGTSIFPRVFDVALTLEAIEKWKINDLGQIPTQFRMLWAHRDYAKYDLSSLTFVAYAGAALPAGEVVEICYQPPSCSWAIMTSPRRPARAISREGILYTGDLGYFKQMGSYRALYLSGRRKFMIKQKGYNVFSDEGIFAFVRPAVGISLAPEAVLNHCKSIAAYKRPLHVEILPVEKPFTLTRSTKVDKMALKEIAAAIIEGLRAKGEWEASGS